MKLIQGDCRDVLREVPSDSIDCIITDPPYSLGYSFANDHLTYEKQAEFMQEYVPELYRVLKQGGTASIFMSQEMSHYLYFIMQKAGFVWQNEIVWNRDGGQMPLSKFGICHEMIVVMTKGPSPKVFNLDSVRVQSKYAEKDKRLNPLGKNPGDVWYVPALFGKKIERLKDAEGRAAHPTQKPIGIIWPLMEVYTNPGDVVLDAFMGSGTVGDCAVQMGRDFIGIELDEDYFITARRRIKEAEKAGAPQ